ncbi:hypothetical protein KKC91_06860 [bacterium]|nr:hypothetical protein [bacterium]
MNFKQTSENIVGIFFTLLKFCLLGISILVLVLFLFEGIKFLLPVIIGVLKLSSSASVQGIQPQSAVESTLNSANFALVYITILFTLIGIILAIVSIWWNGKLNSLERCHRDYKQFIKNSPLETRLTTAKIFVIQENFTEAWEAIKDLPDDFNYEVPLYKAKISIDKPHERSICFTLLKFLEKAISFPRLTHEAKSMIYREFSRVYFKEQDYKKALRYAEKAINENFTHWSAHNAKALALRHLNELGKAIKTLEKIIENDKSYEAAYYNLACYYSQKFVKDAKQKTRERAISYYKDAVRLEPKNKEIAKTDSDLDPIRNDIKDL